VPLLTENDKKLFRHLAETKTSKIFAAVRVTMSVLTSSFLFHTLVTVKGSRGDCIILWLQASGTFCKLHKNRIVEEGHWQNFNCWRQIFVSGTY
jgi:hypothetical protein